MKDESRLKLFILHPFASLLVPLSRHVFLSRLCSGGVRFARHPRLPSLGRCRGSACYIHHKEDVVANPCAHPAFLQADNALKPLS